MESSPQPVKDDPFDLGDTDSVEISGDALPVKPSSPEAAPSAEDRPRNPDGTFAAFQKHIEPAKPDPLAKLPSYLVEQARDFGFSDDEIGEMSVNVLGKTINQMHRQQHALRNSFARERQISDGQVRAPEPKPPEEPDVDLGIDNEADYDPKLLGALKKLARANRDEVKALKGELAQRDMRDRERGNRRSVAMIDAAFAALPEYEKIFGKGPGTQLGSDKPEMRRRIAVLRMANVDKSEIVSVAELKAQIKQATEDLYPSSFISPEADPYAAADKKPEKNGKAKPRITEEEWADGALARPTQRKGADVVKGDALAVANMEKRLRDKGGDTIADAEEMDGFPD